MGTEPGSSSRATSGLNTWIISLPYFLILKFKNYVPWKKLTQIESTYMLYLLNLFFFLCCALEVNMRHSSMSRPLLRRPFQISATLCKRQRKGRMWAAGSRAREWRNGGEGVLSTSLSTWNPDKDLNGMCVNGETMRGNIHTWRWYMMVRGFHGPIEEHWSRISELGAKFVWAWWHSHSSLPWYEFNLFWFVESQGRTMKVILCLLTDLVFV